MATKKQYIVRPGKSEGFEVIARDATRASAVLPTQAQAEERANELNPDNRPNSLWRQRVERDQAEQSDAAWDTAIGWM